MTQERVKRPTGAAKLDIVVGGKMGGIPPFFNGRATEGIDPDQIRKVIEAGHRAFPAVAQHLRGQTPAVQAAILADITGLWLASYDTPAQRAQLQKVYIKLVEQLTDLNLKVLAGTVTLY